jgi:hypothetical protein
VERPGFIAPAASGEVLVFRLQVSDGFEASIPSTGSDTSFDDTVAVEVVLNSAPVASTGSDQTRDEGSLVTLDGSGSWDPDGGDSLTWDWRQIAGAPVVFDDANAATPSFEAPLVGPGGDDLVFELVVTDDDPVNPLSSEPASVAVYLRNISDPPSCGLAFASPSVLWPPDHKLRRVTIEGAMDPESVHSSTALEITGVTQDEWVDKLGKGDTSPDALIQDGNAVLLRAERADPGSGRVYVVEFRASDGYESCTGSVTVTVPHSQNDAAVDDGQFEDATRVGVQPTRRCSRKSAEHRTGKSRKRQKWAKPHKHKSSGHHSAKPREHEEERSARHQETKVHRIGKAWRTLMRLLSSRHGRHEPTRAD